MIVTLGGHVDHGKTAIVKSLTGTDTDRLAEEQARGLTIDLGFAYTDIGEHRIGFVDVPGHHSFIHNMIAGVTRIQHALLVIAADDGVMPQTKEHLKILQLLGVKQGTVVLNKVDCVDPAQLERVAHEAKIFVHQTFLSTASIIKVSAITGAGITNLRESLARHANQVVEADSLGAFRLPIDRAFSQQGIGTIVTGTVYSGEINVGDEVYLTSLRQCVRIRSLVANGLSNKVARAGDRCGVQLAGTNLNEVARGDWLCSSETTNSSSAFTLQFELTEQFPREIKSWCQIHLYHGTTHRLGKLFPLERNLLPRMKGLVDVTVSKPLHIAVGDRVIVRDQGLETTMGGGIVIDTIAPTTRRRLTNRVQRLQELSKAVNSCDPNLALLRTSMHKCVNGDEFRKRWNLTHDQFSSIVDHTVIQQVNNRFLAKSKLTNVQRQLEVSLSELHESNPSVFGLTLPELSEKTSLDSETVRFVLIHGCNTGHFQVQSGQYAVATRQKVTVSYNKDLYKNLLPLIDTQQPYTVGDLARELKVPSRMLENELKRMVKANLFVQVSEKRFFTENRLQELAIVAVELNKTGRFTVKQFRDKCGMGRMVCIEVLEYFDRRGFTQRQEDTRATISNFSAR